MTGQFQERLAVKRITLGNIAWLVERDAGGLFVLCIKAYGDVNTAGVDSLRWFNIGAKRAQQTPIQYQISHIKALFNNLGERPVRRW